MAIDRRNGTEVAMETVQLAEEFMLSSDGLVVGIDLSGDPTVSLQYTLQNLKSVAMPYLLVLLKSLGSSSQWDIYSNE